MNIQITMPTTLYTTQIERLRELGAPKFLIEGTSTNRTRLVADRIEHMLTNPTEGIQECTYPDANTCVMHGTLIKRHQQRVGGELDDLQRSGVITSYTIQ